MLYCVLVAALIEKNTIGDFYTGTSQTILIYTYIEHLCCSNHTIYTVDALLISCIFKIKMF